MIYRRECSRIMMRLRTPDGMRSIRQTKKQTSSRNGQEFRGCSCPATSDTDVNSNVKRIFDIKTRIKLRETNRGVKFEYYSAFIRFSSEN